MITRSVGSTLLSKSLDSFKGLKNNLHMIGNYNNSNMFCCVNNNHNKILKMNGYTYSSKKITLNRKTNKQFPKPVSQSQKQLLTILQKQLQYQQQQNHSSIKQTQLSLSKIGWKVEKKDGRLEFVKQLNNYRFYAFITLKPLLELSQMQKQNLINMTKSQIQAIQQQLEKMAQNNSKNNPKQIRNKIPSPPQQKSQQQKQLQKYVLRLKQQLKQQIYQQSVCQITVFIENIKLNTQKITSPQQPITSSTKSPTSINNKKPSSTPILCLQYITNSQYTQLQSIKLFPSIIKNRIQRIQYQMNRFNNGERNLLTQRFINGQIVDLLLLEMESEMQIRKEVLQEMFNLCVEYQQLEYVGWLKDMKEIVGAG